MVENSSISISREDNSGFSIILITEHQIFSYAMHAVKSKIIAILTKEFGAQAVHASEHLS